MWLLTVAQLLGQISNDKCGSNWLGHNNGIKLTVDHGDHGACTGADECTCEKGFQGEDCSEGM